MKIETIRLRHPLGALGLVTAIALSAPSQAALDGKTDFGFVRPLSQGDRAEVWFPGDGVPTFELDTHLAIHAALRAMRAPAACSASTVASTTAGLPWHWISARSLPV